LPEFASRFTTPVSGDGLGKLGVAAGPLLAMGVGLGELVAVVLGDGSGDGSTVLVGVAVVVDGDGVPVSETLGRTESSVAFGLSDALAVTDARALGTAVLFPSTGSSGVV
jgi:hypothetical protein